MSRRPDEKPVHSPPKKREQRRPAWKRACETQKAKQARRALYGLAFLLGICLVISTSKNMAFAAAAIAYVIMLIKGYIEKKMKGKMTSDLLLPVVLFLLLGSASALLVQSMINNPGAVASVITQIASVTAVFGHTPVAGTSTAEAATTGYPPTVEPTIELVPSPMATKRPKKDLDPTNVGPTDQPPTEPPPTEPSPTDPPPTEPSPTDPPPTEPSPTDPPPTDPPGYQIYHKHGDNGACEEKEFPVTAKPKGWDAGQC